MKMTRRQAPLHPLSAELGKAKVSWARAQRTIDASVPLDRLTDDGLRQELWATPIRWKNDRSIAPVIMLDWLAARGLGLTPALGSSLLELTFRVGLNAERRAVGRWLLAHGADATAPRPYGEALQRAGLAGQVSNDELAEWLGHGLVLDPPTPDDGTLVRLMAAKAKQLTPPPAAMGPTFQGDHLRPWVDQLLAHGVTPRANAQGTTPLMALAALSQTLAPGRVTSATLTDLVQVWFRLQEAQDSGAEVARAMLAGTVIEPMIQALERRQVLATIPGTPSRRARRRS